MNFTMDNEIIIKVENLWKYFDGKPVLKNINAEIEKGKITVVMGRSGCGKTVLMKNIVGILKPEKGKIIFEGRVINELSGEEKLEIIQNFGFLFQNSALFDWLTVEENIAFPLVEINRIKDKNIIKEKVYQLIEIIGLKGHEKKYPAELSGGMQKRTALARAIIHNPKIVILDEPTSGIDPATSSSIEELILDLKKRFGSTFLVITHDIKSAIRLADKIIFMKDGEIIWQGKPQEIVNQKEEEIRIFLKRLEFSQD
ncbi:putative ribonucleotide transport ATP-binding protein mkl [bacterium HR19]|nr:putative ribonucleotide transport ATP-binding protein mkl [bacterium HR19]